MARATLHGRSFRGVENYHDGDFDGSVVFDYFESGNVVWGTFSGDRIPFGVLIGRWRGPTMIVLQWQYLTHGGEFRQGITESETEWTSGGRLRLREHWAAYGTVPAVGLSVVEEFDGE